MGSPSIRTGNEYLSSLVDGRSVFIDGEQVSDVTTHPGFKGAVRTVAEMFDYSANPANGMQYQAPEIGGPALRPFMVPRSMDDLWERNEAIRKWAELTHGFVGRSPDHVGSLLAGFAAHSYRFDTTDHSFGANVRHWYERLLDESLYITYTIVPPAASHPLPGVESAETAQVAVVDEDDDGITVRGAQMLGTGSAIADYLFVSCIKPIPPDFPEFAISFIVPIAADGVQLYCRRAYASRESDTDDYPLSARYDESDAMVVFNDTRVPWSDIFVLRDTALVREQFFETPAHVLCNSQATRRLATKLDFILGITHEVSKLNGISNIPAVVEKLSELSSIVATIEGMNLAADASASMDDQSVMIPNRRFIYALLSTQHELYSRAIGILRELVGGGIMIVPPSPQKDVDARAMQIFNLVSDSPRGTSDRGELMKLAWDVLGSEFAGRHHQYETFYAGSPTVARRWAFEYYDPANGVEAVRQFISTNLGPGE